MGFYYPQAAKGFSATQRLLVTEIHQLLEALGQRLAGFVGAEGAAVGIDGTFEGKIRDELAQLRDRCGGFVDMIRAGLRVRLLLQCGI